jgi:hypothetical protein
MFATLNKYLPFSLSLGALALFLVGGRLWQLGEINMMQMSTGAPWFCGQAGTLPCDAPPVVPQHMLDERALGIWLVVGGFALVALAWGIGLVRAARRAQWSRMISRLVILPLITLMALIGVTILMYATFAPSLLLAVVALAALLYGWADRQLAATTRQRPVSESLLAAQ